MKSRAIIFFMILFVTAASLLMNSCRKTPLNLTHITFSIPPGFPPPRYNFDAAPLSEEGFQLGKKLFYDGRLSVNGNFPCASCHQPVAAFTTFEHDRSHGYNNSHTLRNSPGLFNLAWYPEYNQDGSAKTLEELYERHITNPTEMAESVDKVVNKLKGDAEYKSLFRAAFGDEKITAGRMYKALTQFLMNLVSANSKYDKVKKGDGAFTPEESSGYTLFKAKCATCHQEPLFTDFSYRNTGLEIDAFLNDLGRMRVTGNRADSLKFRVPSLRNAELTSYYGHDGRFNIFRKMIQHYESGIIKSSTLDPLLANSIPLTAQQENDLVSFIRTLTDSSFLTNARFRK